MRGMRDDLSDAIDGLEDSSDLDETRQEVLTDEEETTTEPEGEEQEGAEETGESEESEGEAAEGEATSAETKPKAKAPSDPKGKEKSGGIKAPAGWTPAEREQWSKVPPELQKRIAAREKEMEDNIAGTKDARATYDYVVNMADHYKDLMQQGGFSHPLEAANVAMNSMRTLASGSQEQKAAELARIIGQFGVDIETLDSALVGDLSPDGKPADPQMSKIERMIEERLAPVNQLMSEAQRLQHQQAQQRSTGAQQAVKEFANEAEFLNDVREDMADIIEIAAKRGQNLTLKQAYDRACAAHPEISQIIEQRKQEEAIKGGQQQLAAKRNAASSITGRQSGAGGRDGNMSLRDEIAAAMDEREV